MRTQGRGCGTRGCGVSNRRCFLALCERLPPSTTAAASTSTTTVTTTVTSTTTTRALFNHPYVATMLERDRFGQIGTSSPPPMREAVFPLLRRIENPVASVALPFLLQHEPTPGTECSQHKAHSVKKRLSGVCRGVSQRTTLCRDGWARTSDTRIPYDCESRPPLSL